MNFKAIHRQICRNLIYNQMQQHLNRDCLYAQGNANFTKLLICRSQLRNAATVTSICCLTASVFKSTPSQI